MQQVVSSAISELVASNYTNYNVVQLISSSEMYCNIKFVHIMCIIYLVSSPFHASWPLLKQSLAPFWWTKMVDAVSLKYKHMAGERTWWTCGKSMRQLSFAVEMRFEILRWQYFSYRPLLAYSTHVVRTQAKIKKLLGDRRRALVFNVLWCIAWFIR